MGKKSEKKLDMLFKLRKQQFALEDNLSGKKLKWVGKICAILRLVIIKIRIKGVKRTIDRSTFTFLGKPLM